MAEHPTSQTLVDIILPLEKSEEEASRRQAAALKLGIAASRIQQLKLRKHSIDARQKQIKVQLRLEVGIDAPLPEDPDLQPQYRRLTATARTIVIVGCGPAGMFAALRCIELGLRPILLERGKDASARRFDLGPILKKGTVIEDSNYCFGEGGAGTYSMANSTPAPPNAARYRHLRDPGRARRTERILIDAHPHIGSNLLPKVVMAMRHSILAAGGEVHFGAKVAGFDIQDGTIRSVHTADGREFSGERVILATGHSARDIYQLLHAEGIALEQKPFAVGVRIEHPQPLIDHLQYHFPREQTRSRCCPPPATVWPPKSMTVACTRSACAPAASSSPQPPRMMKSSSMA